MSSPTVRLPAWPGARSLIDPDAVMVGGLVAATDRSSVSPLPAVAALVTVRPCETAAPSRTSPKLTGFATIVGGTGATTTAVTVSVSADSVVGLPARSLVGVSVTVSVNVPAAVGSRPIVPTVSSLPASLPGNSPPKPASVNPPAAPSANAPSRLSASPTAALSTPSVSDAAAPPSASVPRSSVHTVPPPPSVPAPATLAKSAVA